MEAQSIQCVVRLYIWVKHGFGSRETQLWTEIRSLNQRVTLGKKVVKMFTHIIQLVFHEKVKSVALN